MTSATRLPRHVPVSSQATCHVSHKEIANIANMFLHRLVDTCTGYLMTSSTNIVTLSFMILLCRIVHVTSLNFKQHIRILAESESVRLVSCAILCIMIPTRQQWMGFTSVVIDASSLAISKNICALSARRNVCTPWSCRKCVFTENDDVVCFTSYLTTFVSENKFYRQLIWNGQKQHCGSHAVFLSHRKLNPVFYGDFVLQPATGHQPSPPPAANFELFDPFKNAILSSASRPIQTNWPSNLICPNIYFYTKNILIVNRKIFSFSHDAGSGTTSASTSPI